MKTFFPFLLLFFYSCYGQNTTTLTFVNKSPLEIDSIEIQKSDKITLEKLPAGGQYSKTLQNIVINSNREGLFGFKVYLKGKVFIGSWGFHDYGVLASKNEVFYIFENGISSTDKELQKPKEFNLYFYNASSGKVDSFISRDNAIIKITERTPRSFEVIYDYNKIEKSKEFSIMIDGKKRSSPIQHDFSYWNNAQTNFLFENDSLKTGVLPWREPLEFIFELIVKIPVPSDSVRAESDAIVKTYYFKKPNYLWIVFDFKKLKANPVFTVTVANKRYRVDLSSHDFSNIYYNQRIFFLEEKGIRSLTD